MLYPKQAAFLRSDAFYRGFVGGRGTGKTYIGAYDLLKRAKPKRQYSVISSSYSQIEDGPLRSFVDLGDKFQRIRRVKRSTPFRVTISCGGPKKTSAETGVAEVIFRSAADEDKLRGSNWSGIWFDEASLIKEDSYKTAIACLREGGERGWVSATFTPKGKSHWTYSVFVERETSFLVHAHSMENPFIDEEYVESLAADYSGELAQQELAGMFIDFAGQLIKWDWIINCTSEESLWKDGVMPSSFRGDLFIGVDIGRTSDKTVVWTWEKLGDVCWCRECLVLDNVPYPQQQEEIAKRISRRGVVKAAMDSGTIGHETVERMQQRFGKGLVEAVGVSRPAQKRMAERMRAGFESGKIRIPDDEKLRADLQLVTLDDDGEVLTKRQAGIGHGDRFWAAALGYEPAANIAPEHDFRPVAGKPKGHLSMAAGRGVGGGFQRVQRVTGGGHSGNGNGRKRFTPIG